MIVESSSLLLTKVAATGAAGIAAGALTFVSFVDTRTYVGLVNSGEEATVKKLFPRWWPNGRDLMVPVVALCTLTHGVAYWASGDPSWLWSGALLFSIGPYTKLVLGEDIEGLRKAGTKDVAAMTRRFCSMHHLRLVAAAAAFAVSLFALGTSPPP
ncbi:unnamed protein product [Discosporangium mesarthrocarpum]